MRIIEFTAENFKGIHAVNITPDGDVVELVGGNAQGKTSIIDAIWAALGGGDASRKTKQPIRDGEKRASVKLDLGEYIVTRVWEHGKTTLEVSSPRGAKYDSPQKVLNGLIGARAFDPLSFMNQSGRDQVATLVDMLGDSLGFDPAKLEKDRAEAFDNRAASNRDVKKLTAQLAGLPDAPADTPDTEITVTELMAEVNSIHEHNANVTNAEGDSEDAADRLGDARASVKLAEDELAAARAHLLKAKRGSETADAYLATLARKSDEAVQSKLATVDVVNGNVQAKRRRAVVADDLVLAKSEAAAYDKVLEQIEKKKADGLAAAKLPHPGLSFDEDGVTLNGVPLVQASGAEQLRVSVALAMAMNPELRVLCIDKAEALDAAGRQIIADMAADNDYQLWTAAVDETGRSKWVISEGRLKE